MSYSVPKAALVFLIFIFLIVGLAQSASAFETHCQNDTVKDQGTDDTEWVDAGSLDVSWKTTSMDTSGTSINVDVLNESGEYAPVPYVLKVDDIDTGLTMARFSLAKAKEGAKPIHDVLYLQNETGVTGANLTDENTTGENTSELYADWCQIDHELKVQLTDITVDSQETPHVQFKYFKRGNPRLDIDIKSDQSGNGSQVNGTTYFPEKERDVKITVKNSGEAWIESIKLDVDLTDFDLVSSTENHSESSIRTHGNYLSAELGWLAKNEERAINFTIRSPSWSDVNSRLKLNPVNITAVAAGDDILGYEHKGNKTLSLNPPDPDIEATQTINPYSYSLEKINQARHNGSGSNSTSSFANSSGNEIIMSSWYIKGSEVHGLKGYFSIRQTVHNLQGYYLKNLSFVFPSVPEGLIIAKIRGNENSYSNSGNSPDSSRSTDSAEVLENANTDPFNGNLLKSLAGMKSNKADYILIPTHPGTYQLGSFSVNTEYEGHNLSKTSEAASLVVHGPQIVVNKSVGALSGDVVDVNITVKNYGDRIATANLTDRVPEDARLVQDSINISRNGQPENNSIPLRNWELKTSKEKNATSILMSFPLRPNEYYDLKYSIQPGNLSNMDLPPAKVNFVDLNAYKGTVYSSFFKSGAEVKQTFNYYENKWEVTSEHWDASTGAWEDNWDPIVKRWTNETISFNSSANDTELDNDSLTGLSEPLKDKSTLDQIIDFISGFLPGGKKASGPSNSSEQSNLSAQPMQNNSGNESVFIRVKNFVTGLLPGGGQKSATSSQVSPASNPTDKQSSDA
ncbi:MAG: hypothetical protein QG646_1142 [Euryarchaeota archaeon]|nr:hypothetical protein [Euryarchaeota archaeon]